MNVCLREAIPTDQILIWEIFEKAIARRKSEGSTQWQDGYPNKNSIAMDIQNKVGYVLLSESEIVGYAAIIFDVEPDYAIIEGKWISDEQYAVVHRVAISESQIGKGFATKLFFKIEEFVEQKNIFSIKVDTKSDNFPMLKIFDKLNYTYCGEVYLRGNARRAYQKILK